MAIDINSVGNYSLYGIKKPNNSNSIERKETHSNSDQLNIEEKKFFAKMYPSKQNEIMNHYFYEKSGKLKNISTGTNIDRRG